MKNNITYINAGAGSGKTYTLTETLLEKVKNGCLLSEVILCTFTKAAAADLQLNSRQKFLQHGLNEAAAAVDTALISTVHGIGERYIQKYWYLLGLSAQMTVITDEDKTIYINKTLADAVSQQDHTILNDHLEHYQLKEMGKPMYDFWKPIVIKLIELAEAFGIDNLHESHEQSLALAKRLELDTDYQQCISTLFAIANRWRTNYRSYKQEHSLIDFNDMENLFLVLLDQQEVQNDIHDCIRFLFVDEFQDSNPKQVKIFDKLSELVEHSYWVGDPKQAIYGFRGTDAALTNAVMTKIRHMDASNYKNLDTSRRSLKPLVETSNTMFSQIFEDMSDVTLKPFRADQYPSGAQPFYHWDFRNLSADTGRITGNDEDLANGIAFKISEMLADQGEIRMVFDPSDNKWRKIQPKDIAVLYRQGDIGKNIISCLRKYHIPVAADESIPVANCEIALMSILLNFVLDNRSDLLRAELLMLEKDYSTEQIINNYEHLLNDTQFEHLFTLRNQLQQQPVSAVVRSLILQLDLIHTCGKWGNANDRKRNLMGLISAADAYEKACNNKAQAATIGGFLLLLNNPDTCPVTAACYYENGIHVSTWHGSKGLQWPVVILVQLDGEEADEKKVMKYMMSGITTVRKNNPDSEHLYSDYYFLCLPHIVCGNKSLPQSITDQLRSESAFINNQLSCLQEAKRLFYVAFTRARDYIITTSKKGGALKRLAECGIDSCIDKNATDGSQQSIFGSRCDTIAFSIVSTQPPLETSLDSEYNVLHKETPDARNSKYISPSQIKSTSLVTTAPKVVFNANQRITNHVPEGDYDAFGTCIHNIFAIYDPNNKDMVTTATEIINAHQMSNQLPHAQEVVDSIHLLYNFLSEQYGTPVRIAHETPFSMSQDGQEITGEIDLLWYTSADQVVLIDFKSYPGSISMVTDPSGTHSATQYLPQLKAYNQAIERAGIKVLDCLIYYAVLGVCVRTT